MAVKLVREHLWPRLNFDDKQSRIKASDASIRRLAMRLYPATIQELVAVAEADTKGRAKKVEFPEGRALLERARHLEVVTDTPQPLLLGRHLIELGLKPGPSFGVILKQVMEAQIDGRVTTLEEATELAKEIIRSEPVESTVTM